MEKSHQFWRIRKKLPENYMSVRPENGVKLDKIRVIMCAWDGVRCPGKVHMQMNEAKMSWNTGKNRSSLLSLSEEGHKQSKKDKFILYVLTHSKMSVCFKTYMRLLH